MPQNLSAQFVCPSPKILDFNEKRLQWTSVVRGMENAKLAEFGKILKRSKAMIHFSCNWISNLLAF